MVRRWLARYLGARDAWPRIASAPLQAPTPVVMLTSPAPEPSLPLQLTSFVGREGEVADVRRHLGGTRLLTITGAGGSGKTRLALEVARHIAGEDAGAVAWVDLAPLAEPELLPQQVVAVLGIREDGGCPATESILRHLQDRALLLVLDNCEHLADACAALTDIVLRGCAGVRVLATSREALGVAGERAWLVPPLSLPDPSAVDPERLGRAEAVQLFVARARDALPSFALSGANAAAVAHVCRRLDGIPLAIELAAARVKVLTPQQISDRLDDVFALLGRGGRTALPRHRTLRAAIDWSFQLLSEPEQRLLRRLSVFAGGFTLDAVEAVCADEALEAGHVLDLLARLVDRSMVAVEEHGAAARYRLLETVRQYARERLQEAGEAAVQGRHAEHFARLAEEARVELERAGSPEAVACLGVEQDNFRAALQWSLTQRNDLELALRLVSALWRYWFHANLWSEGSAWCEAMLSAVPERAPSALWARVLNGAGTLAYLARDAARCRSRLEEADRMCQALGASELHAFTSYRLAHLYADLGEAGPALERAEAAVRHARAGREPWLLAEALVYALAFVHRLQDRPELAERALAEAEVVARASGSNLALAEAHIGQFLLAFPRGDIGAMETHARGAYEAARRMGDLWYVSRALTMASAAAARAGEAGRAARLLGFAATLREAAGTLVFPHEQAFHDEVVVRVRRALGEAELRATWDAGAAMRFPEIDALVAGGAGARPVAASPAPAKARPSAALQSAVASDRGGAPSLHVLALGPLEIRLEGELLSSSAWPQSRPRELLLHLLAHPDGRTREQIRRAFWPELSPAQAKNNFHVILHRLRRVLGGNEWVVLDGDRYRINPECSHEMDAVVFERRITAELREARAGRGSAERLGATLALYRGDFLEGEAVGDWHMEIHDHLRRLYVDALSVLADLQMAGDDFAGAAGTLERLTMKEELREEAYRRLMLCLARAGHRDRALRHFDRLRILLRGELEAEPEAETRELAERIRTAAG